MIEEKHIIALEQLIGKANVFLDSESIEKYGRDETEKLFFPPDIVVKPETAAQVAAVLKYSNEHHIIVTPRGGGTGESGGALPHKGGIVLSVERLNRIIEIDEDNLQVIVEPGVITQVLQEAVEEKGLFYPPDPSSRGTCFIGGNIAENSGGPRAVKYGVVKDYVLNLEVVLPTGEIIWTGANVLKNVTGYNLTQLMVGSEGTLGIVTKIVFKLIPRPKNDLLILAPFTTLENAGMAVSAIFKAGITPSALEIIEKDALQIVSQMVGNHLVPVGADIAAHLIVELDGNHIEQLMQEMELVATVLEKQGAGEIFFAENAQQKEELWKLRRRAAEAVKLAGYSIEEDTVVPRANLPKLIAGVKELGRQFDFQSVCYGHAGDGNLHVRIKKNNKQSSYQDEEIQIILRELFLLVKNLGGTLTGEHGVGLIQKGFLDIFCDPKTIELMKGVKKLFDPNHILNTDKIF